MLACLTLALMAPGLALVSCDSSNMDGGGTDDPSVPVVNPGGSDTYTVTFNLNGGSGTTPAPQTADAGSSITLPGGNDLFKSGYAFDGWNTEPDGAGINYSAWASYTVDGDVTLYARWIADNSTAPQTVAGNRIEYYWVDEHGSLLTTGGGAVDVFQGQTLTITAQGDGYAVQQWRLNGINTGESGNTYDFSSTTAGEHTIDLFVEKDGKLYSTSITITVAANYTVTFNANGGSGTTPAAQTVNAGSSITLPGANGLTMSDYTFGGWNTEPDGTGTNYNAEDSYKPIGDVTLYARWEQITVPGVPTGVSASASSSSIRVSWTAVSNADGYYVYRSSSSSGTYTSVGTSSSASYTDTGLLGGTAYYYKVSAYNSAGESAQSSYTSATTSLGDPSPVTATGTSGYKVNVSWTAVPGATGYQVYYDLGNTENPFGGRQFAGTFTGTSCTVNVGTNLYAYFYVRATNGRVTSDLASAPRTQARP